jgi:CHAD domain-containing protein
MEIEAKFAVPDRTAYRQLARLRSLAHFTLRSTRVSQIADRYFDTADGRLLQGGYACRLRTEGEVIVVTLKGLGGAAGAVHRRTEEEVRLAQWSPEPAAWPESRARTLALVLTGGVPLLPLFDLTQRRSRADVLEGERRVAELSLDAVRTDLTSLHRPVRSSYYELEIELAPAGHETDLAEMTAELANTWALPAEPHSKYERALDMLRQRQAAEALAVTPAERRAIEAHAAAPATPFGHRAAAVLGWEDGLPIAEIASRAGLSAGRVRYWVRAFRASRLGIFGGAAAAPIPPPIAMVNSPAPPPAPPPPPAVGGRTSTAATAGVRSVKQLAAAHGVDLPHARRVADQACLLFDALKTIHKLSKKRRPLLRSAALLNTVGAARDSEHPHATGRDLILAAPLQKISTAERLALGCIVAFGGGKLRGDREPAMAALDDKLRRDVLPLAALVRVAEALDASRTQRTEIQALTGVDSPRCEITLAGPAAARDAAQANSQADAWRQIFKHQLVFVGTPTGDDSSAPPAAPELPAASDAATGAARPVGPVELPPLAADDPMSEAGRKVLALHFGRMLANEAGTRLGEDPEALHDMRVATRRMRAAFALFEPYYDAKIIRPFGKGLRRAGRTLGAVRDLDVLLEKARAYAVGLPAGADGIEPLLAAWAAARDIARGQMLEYLDGPAYRKFVAEFGAFLATPSAGAVALAPDVATPYQARHVIPRLILTRYASVRAYERLLSAPGAALTTYHALRIECKGLRYALEFFREVLGEETPTLIKQVTALQDLLGELQDACVAAGLLADFLDDYRKEMRKQATAVDLTGIEAYLAAQHARQAELLAVFPAPWADLVGLEFRRRLALAIAVI